MNIQRFWNDTPIVIGRWTLKETIQGKPIRHPSHALFVHFPSALLPAAFVFDIISRIHAEETLARAAFYNIAFGLAMASGAIVTGLVDYLPMVSGSRKKTLGTYHLLAQVPAMALFAISLALRAMDFDTEQTGLAALALAGLGTLGVLVGNYFGGELVYRQGMRVSVDV
jgi:uncharacterized membrane protein